MADGTTESNLATAVAEPPAGQTVPASTGTPQGQDGQASDQGQSATVEEQFSSIDPKTLPPEVQAIYKNLQADYTKKTQSIAEQRKKAEYYDQLAADQRIVDFVRQMNNPKPAETKQQEVVRKSLAEMITPEEFEQAFQSREKFLGLLE